MWPGQQRPDWFGPPLGLVEHQFGVEAAGYPGGSLTGMVGRDGGDQQVWPGKPSTGNLGGGLFLKRAGKVAMAPKPGPGDVLLIAAGGDQPHGKALFVLNLQGRGPRSVTGVAKTAGPPDDVVACRNERPRDGPGPGRQQTFSRNGRNRVDQPDQPAVGASLFGLPPLVFGIGAGKRRGRDVSRHRKIVSDSPKSRCHPRGFAVFSPSFFQKRDFLQPIPHNRCWWPRSPTPMLLSRCQGPARQQQRLFLHGSVPRANYLPEARAREWAWRFRPRSTRWAGTACGV